MPVRRALLSAIFAVIFAGLFYFPAVAGSGASLMQPGNGATVSGTIPLSLGVGSSVQWSNFYIDGNYYASTPPSTAAWDTTTVANGLHTISATAYSPNKTIMGLASAT